MFGAANFPRLLSEITFAALVAVMRAKVRRDYVDRRGCPHKGRLLAANQVSVLWAVA